MDWYSDPLTILTAAFSSAALAAILLWPYSGLLWRWRRLRQLTGRVRLEDAVKHIHEWEAAGRWPSVDSLAGALQLTENEAAALLDVLLARAMISLEGDRFRLTPEGRDYALHIIRAHRLWERFLADETGFHETEWHTLAELMEHSLTPADTDALAARLGNPTHDPHGDPIPTATGELAPQEGRPLTTIPVNQPLRIVHVEDEPEAVYAQLVAEGLRPGMEGRTTEISDMRVRLWVDGDEHVLAPVVAANLHAVPVLEDEVDAIDTVRLSALEPGQKARVVKISAACRGAERRRLMDLGLLPGTLVAAELSSPTGGTVAYSIRGALIALRRQQAHWIHVSPVDDEE